MSLVELAQEEAARRGVEIESVHIRVGRLSGVVKEALLSSYEMACFETPLQGSHLVIEDVPVVVFCPTCKVNRDVNSEDWFICSDCGSPTPNVIQGKELEMVALEIRE